MPNDLQTLSDSLIGAMIPLADLHKSTAKEITELALAAQRIAEYSVNYSLILISRHTLTGIEVFGLNSLTDVYTTSQFGDLVTVNTGTYDLGNVGIQLKNGVNWQFLGNPSIISTSSLGTFYDSNQIVDVEFFGNLDITNSHGLRYKIFLQNIYSTLNNFSENGYVPKTSSQSLFVIGTGSVAQNYSSLMTAYTKAKSMLPYGNPLSSTNRVSIFISPGLYNDGNTLTVNSNYIDFISLSGKADVIISNISVVANDVFLKGINVGSSAFSLVSSLPALICENCVGGVGSFSANGVANGTFTNCIADDNSFGLTSSGTFTNCSAGNNSFGGNNGVASGTFSNCSAGYNSFGGTNGVASGTFIDCVGGDNSFGQTASGTFTNCIADDYSFGDSGGTGGIASGTFTNCVGGEYSFGSTSSGTFTNCSAGNNSFGLFGVASGTFFNCSSGDYSFGSSGITSGTFSNCVGGLYSFGNDFVDPGVLSGKLFWCRLSSGDFKTVTSPGITRMCLTGSNVLNNQG